MTRKRKPAPKRTRRSPYERSLEYATKRLAKAIDERAHAAHRLEDLDKEIPYLQTVIRALTPREQRQVINMRDLRPDPYAPKGIGGIFREIPPPPTTASVDELPSEEDQFLNVTIPGEKEVLP